MKVSRYLSVTLLICVWFGFTTVFAQYEPHTQIGLPKDAVARFGTGPFGGYFEYILAYSPNAAVPQFAVPGIFGIWLYDAETLQVEGLLDNPYPDVLNMSYSPDGKILATGHYDGTIQLWYVPTNELSETLTPNPGFRREVRSLSFSPDGNILAAGIGNGTIELWNTNPGGLKILEGHNETIDNPVEMRVSFSNDSRTLASTSRYSEVHLWDVATCELIKTLGKQSWGTRNVSFSPDGNTMATYNHTGLHLWDVETYKVSQTFKHSPDLMVPRSNNKVNISFSPDGNTLVTHTYNKTSHSSALHLWDVATGTLRDVLRGPYKFMDHISYSPDGNILAVTANTGIYLWYVTSRGVPYYQFSPQVLNPQTAISPNGEMLATGRLLWDISTGTLRGSFDQGLSSTTGTTAIKNVSFSPDGKTLAISEGNSVILFDVDQRILVHTLTGHVGRAQDVKSISFSPDSSILATGSVFFDTHEKGELFLWDVATGQQKTNFPKHVGNVYSLSFSPDGKTLAAGIDDTVHLMDAKTGEIFNTFPKKGGIVYSLSFSPDGKTLVTGSDDKVRLWTVATGTIRTTFDTSFGEHTPNIYSVKFSPDGRTLAASIYNTVHLWDVATNDIKAILKGHVDDVYSVDFSSDGNLLASGSVDGTALLWDVKMAQHLKTDVNSDGIVNIIDLLIVGSQFGQKGENEADVNGDGVVNIKDLLLVAAAFRNVPAAPTLQHDANEHLTPEIVQQWIEEARKWNFTDVTLQRGIAVLEVLMTALTPKEVKLLPNYPNPFNPETWIPYQLAKPTDVSLIIYAPNGAIVRTLKLGHQPAGFYESRSRAAYWDGRNEVGEPVASGVYFYTLTAGEFTATRKMLIRK